MTYELVTYEFIVSANDEIVKVYATGKMMKTSFFKNLHLDTFVSDAIIKNTKNQSCVEHVEEKSRSWKLPERDALAGSIFSGTDSKTTSEWP